MKPVEIQINVPRKKLDSGFLNIYINSLKRICVHFEYKFRIDILQYILFVFVQSSDIVIQFGGGERIR